MFVSVGSAGAESSETFFRGRIRRQVVNQLSQNRLGSEAVKFDYLATRGVTANQFHLAARTIKGIRQQLNQGLVCCRVDRRRGHLDPQGIAERFANFVG